MSEGYPAKNPSKITLSLSRQFIIRTILQSTVIFVFVYDMKFNGPKATINTEYKKNAFWI